MTTDSNAGALDAALDTAIAFADLAPTPDVIKYAAGEDCKIFPNVVDKAFQGKSSTIAKYVLGRVRWSTYSYVLWWCSCYITLLVRFDIAFTNAFTWKKISF